MKKVSIIIPVYNVECYLKQCLDSVTAQNYRNLEIIIVDDGSTDHSGIICEEYAAMDRRVRVIHQVNAGAANAKNAGLDAMTGEYVAFVDSDDFVERDWICKMVVALENSDADIAECDFVKEYIQRTEPGNDDAYASGIYTAGEYLSFYLHNWTCSLFWNKLFKAELLNGIRFRRERRCIDDEFFTYKLLSGARKIVRIGERLYHYRQRKSSAVSSGKNKKQITDDALEILIERYKWMKAKHPCIAGIYLKHDVEIMFYFAREFVFTDETVRKFRRTARYYLMQSILHFPGRISLQYAVLLQLIKTETLLQKQISAQFNGSEELFP